MKLKTTTMKTKVQTALIIALIALTGITKLIAQTNNNLIVFSETGDRFYLVLNGLKYNQNPETNVKVTNLNAPMYKAKIIFEKPQPDLEANVHIMWEGNAVNNKEFTYAVTKKADKYKLKFISQTDMGAVNTYDDNSVIYNVNGTAAPNTNISTTTNGVNVDGYNTNTTITTTGTSMSSGQTANIGVNVNGANANINTNIPNGQVTTTTYSTTTTTTSYSSNSNINTQPVNPPSANANGCAMPMHEGTFNSLTESVNKQSFEESKLKIAKQAISASCVSAGQVKKLMGLFSFEESKLELAKFAYKHTCDKQNYFKINDAFTYSSSVDDLTNYLNSQQ